MRAASLLLVVAGVATANAEDTGRFHLAKPAPPMPPRAVEMIAVTGDGRVAVSTDLLAHVKLWQELDHKPVDVDLPQPTALAIAASKRGFEIAVVDDAGDLVIANVDEHGKLLARASLANEPAFVGVHMASVGAVAWREDHTIVVVAADGKITARIAAPPGDRVTAVATSGAHAIVLLRTHQTQRLRHLALGDKPAWGAWIDAEGSPLAATDIALSPNGQRLAMIVRGDGQPRVEAIDTASGKVLVDEVVGDVRAIALCDANHLAIVGADKLAWIDVADAHAKLPDADLTMPRNTASPVATGGGRLILATRQHPYAVMPPR